MSQLELEEEVEVPLDEADSGSRPLSAKGVFWAVFLALWAYSLTAGLIYLIVRAGS